MIEKIIQAAAISNTIRRICDGDNITIYRSSENCNDECAVLATVCAAELLYEKDVKPYEIYMEK
jgi:hypothetical protein